MTRTPRALLAASAVAGLLAATAPASATATLTCDVNDGAVEFHVQTALGQARAFSAITAELAMKARGSVSALTVQLTADHLVQRWATGRDVRLRFFRDDAIRSVDLTIEARGRADDEAARPGTYRLEMIGPAGGGEPRTIIVRGRATCTLG